MPVLALLVVVGGPALLTALALGASSLAREPVDTRREWVWVRLTWVAALAIGGLTAWWVGEVLDLGRGLMLVPAVLGLFAVAGVGLGETVVRPHRPTGPRTASLAPRRVADYVPRTLLTAVGAIAAVEAGTLALTTATAVADDLGRSGRQVAARCGDARSATGPYPGSFYSVPLLVLLVLVGLVAAAALVAVARRPRGFARDEAGEDVLRHRSMTRVVAAAGAAVAASQAGIALFAGSALLRLDCTRPWMQPAGWVLAATIPVALLLLVWFLGRIASPGRRPAPALTSSAGAR